MPHRKVKIAEGHSAIVLPDGGTYDEGQTAVLTEEQFDRIQRKLIGDVVIDEGPLESRRR